MSMFGALMNDVEDDPFFGAHMRHMRHMNNMMNSMFSDPFGMFGGGGGPLGIGAGGGPMGMGGGGPLAIGGPGHGGSLMQFMPQMPGLNMNRLLAGNLDGGMMGGSSYSSSTVVMSSGPNGRPQVVSQTQSTKVGPNGIKETRKTLEDSRYGTKKMAIGHHIGERAHLIEREQNVYSGDAEERQEFINLDEEEVDHFDREFQEKAGSYMPVHRPRLGPGSRPQLAIGAPPTSTSRPTITELPSAPTRPTITELPVISVPMPARYDADSRRSHVRPSARRPLRTTSSNLGPSPTSSASIREVYGSAQPQRHKHRHHKSNRHSPDQ